MSTFRLGLKHYETCFRMRSQDASASRARASSVIVIAHDTDGTTGYETAKDQLSDLSNAYGAARLALELELERCV